MSLEVAFWNLSHQLMRFRDIFSNLRLTVVEDKPQGDEVALIDLLGSAVDDVIGWTTEALESADHGRQASGDPFDVVRARRALTTCQELFGQVHQHLLSLLSYDQIDELMHLGRERKGEWLAWSASVKEGLEHCHQPLDLVSQALLLCWQEIAERVSIPPVSVHTVSIGQQIRVPKDGDDCGEEPADHRSGRVST